MTLASTPMEVSGGRFRRLGSIYLELAKARLTALVVTTTLAGFLVAPAAYLHPGRLLWTVLGTALAAGGGNALNQWLEVDLDRRMERTRRRPLPSGRIGSRHAFLFGLVLALGGPLLLLLRVNLLTALLGLGTVLLYLMVYSPLKTRTPFCTLFGAVCGAIPPMMGWVGATGEVDLGAWVLGAILFIWQIPHFLALGWLYRADYARASFRMLPVIDPSGRITFRMMILYVLILVPAGLSVTVAGVAGSVYAAGSLLLGLGLIVLGIKLYRLRDETYARRLFLATVVYLPLLLGLMVFDQGPVGAKSISPPVIPAKAGIQSLSTWPGE